MPHAVSNLLIVVFSIKEAGLERSKNRKMGRWRRSGFVLA